MRTSESGALPGASGDQLERASDDLRARRSDADDARDAPALVGRFEGLTLKDIPSTYALYASAYHALDVSDALESVVETAVELLDQVRLEVLALRHVLLRVHVVGGSEQLR